jgi:hypothetical protein
MLPDLPPEILTSVKKFQNMVKDNGNHSDKEIAKVLDSHVNKITTTRVTLDQLADKLTRFEGSYVGLCGTIHQIMRAKQKELEDKLNKEMDIAMNEGHQEVHGEEEK